MKYRFSFLSAAILTCIFLSTDLRAMPELKLPDGKSEVVDDLIRQQNMAVEADDFETALALNQRVETQLRKIENFLRYEKTLNLYDRAIILENKKSRNEALDILKGIYSTGEVDNLLNYVRGGDPGLPLDYYGNIMTTYIDWLRDDGDPEWRVTADGFLKKLYSNENSEQRIELSNYAIYIFAILIKEGEYDNAKRVCSDQVHWLIRFNSNLLPLWLPFGHYSVSGKGKYVTSFVYLAAPYKKEYQFAWANVSDSCAVAAEALGELKDAVQFRQASIQFIQKGKFDQYEPLVKLRLARLFIPGNRRPVSRI